MSDETLHRQSVVALVWDFDKTLIPGYMQGPLFRHYGVDEKRFWREVNVLPSLYAEQGMIVSGETAYLNHILSYARAGLFPRLNNRLLRELGQQLEFYPGLPEFFGTMRDYVQNDPVFRKNDIVLEHYIISTGLSEMIRGSAIAPFVEDIYGCEFLECPLGPNFEQQSEMFPPEEDREVAQIGRIVDNTIKTRFVFEINKGTNKNPAIDVNAKIDRQDRRIPIQNMIYIADGPSDVPVFSVVRKNGGKAYAVYESGNAKEFAQNDALRRAERVDHFGRADYRPKSDTHMWLKMHVHQICERIVMERQQTLARRVGRPPQHLHRDEPPPPSLQQAGLEFQGEEEE